MTPPGWRDEATALISGPIAQAEEAEEAEREAIRAARQARLDEGAAGWPLLTTYDPTPRARPDGTTVTGWAMHIRCVYGECGQSVLAASNDSGAYVWCPRNLADALAAHIMQCHRGPAGIDGG